MEKLLQIKTLVITERFKYHSGDHGKIESVQYFFNELKYLSKTWKFGKFHDEAMRERFVCGLYNDNFQKRQISEKDLRGGASAKIGQIYDFHFLGLICSSSIAE